MKYKKQINKIIKGTNITFDDIKHHAIQHMQPEEDIKDYLLWSALDLLKDQVVFEVEALEPDGENNYYWNGKTTLKPKILKKILKLLKGK